jgi:hypothetical protein
MFSFLHQRLAFCDLVDALQGGKVNRCIKKHPHPVRKQFPPGKGYKNKDDCRSNLIDGNAQNIYMEV